MKNRLYYGDNLDILMNREYFPDECDDLTCVDPHCKSGQRRDLLGGDRVDMPPQHGTFSGRRGIEAATARRSGT